jgi:hypothetical protein
VSFFHLTSHRKIDQNSIGGAPLKKLKRRRRRKATLNQNPLDETQGDDGKDAAA